MVKFLFSIFLLFTLSCYGNSGSTEILTGADQPEIYIPLIKYKRVGLVVNHTSRAAEMHLVDFLVKQKVEVKMIFAPEHGFRGNFSDGEEIFDGLDRETGIPVVSLYGTTKKPTIEHLENLDVLMFDIQDVGCRFYTFLSTLALVMEACAEYSLPLIVLDRPNPNGDYVAGPILDRKFESFVGMLPVPLVHGCTLGEMAGMINGEKWHNADKDCDLTVVPVRNYSHAHEYKPPVQPSPNLPNYRAVRLYPSLCFFEATSVSVGRGTEHPFQALGGADPHLGDFSFIPRSKPGISVNPPNKDKVCYGIDLRKLDVIPPFTLKYFLDFYAKFENEEDFLTRVQWLNLLAGTDKLIEMIRAGKNETEILESWKGEIAEYMILRKKYLLYPDFE